MTTAAPAIAVVHKPSFVEFIRQFFTNFDEFMQKHIREEKPMYFIYIVWLFGAARTLERFDLRSMQGETLGIDSMIMMWIGILFFALIPGYIAYWLGGFWYHARVRMSGGAKALRTSMNINLYTGLPVYLLVIFSSAIDSVLLGDNYFVFSEDGPLDWLWGLMGIGAVAYSIYLSYRAVRSVQGTKKWPSIFWFIASPILVYLLIYVVVAVNMLQPAS